MEIDPKCIRCFHFVYSFYISFGAEVQNLERWWTFFWNPWNPSPWATGRRRQRKWRAKEEVQKVMGKLQHKQIVGMVQTGRADGWSEPPILWSKASNKERKDLVVEEVTRIEQEELRVRSVAQGQQGRWTTWEGVANRAISWAEFWKLPQARLSFLIRATYNTLPSPKNLHQWLGTEQSCDLCGTINASLQHVLSGWKTALTQGRLRW